MQDRRVLFERVPKVGMEMSQERLRLGIIIRIQMNNPSGNWGRGS
jgi:hypothetical protein